MGRLRLGLKKFFLSTPFTNDRYRSIQISVIATRVNFAARNPRDTISTCFQWRDDFYEQTNGAAMGSPLSPVLANIFMEHFEQNALANSALVPKLWKRYVDDIFAVWSHGKEHLNKFLSYHNNIHPSIKFTIEQEND